VGDSLVAIQDVVGHNGKMTKALYQQVTTRGTGPDAESRVQVPLIWFPGSAKQGDFYTSAYFKLQDDLASQLVPDKMPDGAYGNWRALFEWKTGDAVGHNTGNGDYRVIVLIKKSSTGLYWSVAGDNDANGSYAKINCWGPIDNTQIPVPAGKWFHFETFTHRSGEADGRFWVKVNGQIIADHSGPNMGSAQKPINRVFLSQVYSDGNRPFFQWVDDVEIWDGVPDREASK
jgi:hypothetical protein